jgi:hypothetical protein
VGIQVSRSVREQDRIGAKEWGRGKAVQDNWGREVGKEQDRASKNTNGPRQLGQRSEEGVSCAARSLQF